jgi:large subunit ribosomal protein L15
LQRAIDAGKLDAKAPVTGEVLVQAGVVRRLKDGVRLLVNGTLSAKITITVAGASKGAVAMIEKNGGSVEVTAKKNAAGEDTSPSDD